MCEQPPIPTTGFLSSLSAISDDYLESLRSLLGAGNVGVSWQYLEIDGETAVLPLVISVKLPARPKIIDVSISVV